MPIYKITVPERVVSAKTRIHLASPPSPTWNDSSSDHGSASGTLAFIELTEADRERERTMARKQDVTSHADHGQVKTEQQQQPIKETIITREIRLQMEREAELEALHKALVHLTTTHAKEPGLNHGNRHGDAHHHGDPHRHGDAHHHGDPHRHGDAHHHGDGRQHGGVGQHHAGTTNHHGDNRTMISSVDGRGRDHVTSAYDPTATSGQHHWITGSAGHGVKVTAHQHQHDGVESKGHGVKVASDFSRRHVTAAASSAKRPPEDTRIVKELLEQRRREEELREHWKEIGMEVEKRDFDTTDSVFLLTDIAAPPSPHHHGNGVAAVTKETRVLSDADPPQQHHGWTRSQSSVPSPQEGRRPSTPRVQPFEEFEKLHFENEVPYTPHRESLMEREIRSVLMREDALRLTRGLGPLMIDDHQAKVEVVKPRPRLSESVEEQLDLATSMKKYAENRLRKELQTEKQREIDLLQLGKIRSLSEHRTGGEPLKYAELPTPDIIGEPGTPKLRRDNSRDHGARFSAEMTHKDPHHHHHQQQQHHGEVGFEVRGHADHRSAPSSMPSANYPSRSVSRPSSQVYNVSHGEVKGQGQGQGQGHYSARSAAEKRIELEVLEVRRRENELKELRKSMMDLTADKGHHDDGHVTGSSGATGHAHDVIIRGESEGRASDHSHHQDTGSAGNRNSRGLSLSFSLENHFYNSD